MTSRKARTKHERISVQTSELKGATIFVTFTAVAWLGLLAWITFIPLRIESWPADL